VARRTSQENRFTACVACKDAIEVMDEKSLQETYAPDSVCFGCGPKNDKGLRIRSFVETGDACLCTWRPLPHHLAFPGLLNGGICGALLDCHSNWTAAWHLMRKAHASGIPPMVTAEFAVKLRRPTPLDVDLAIRAHVVESKADSATIEAQIEASGKVTATCRGLFVAVKEGHPAFHRW
jgi:acyl-coenzyme A thioesterase PaaI-like protein